MTTETGEEIVSLIYQGGIAARGELHLYEFSRALYAYSRLIQTIEYYRREGRVAERITGPANTDIIIRAPQKGSFVADAIVLSSQAAPFLKAIPFKALFTYVIEYVKPKSVKSEDTVIALARIELNKEKQRTKQSHEETERLRLLKDIVDSEQATVKQALDLVQTALSNKSLPADVTHGSLLETQGRLRSDQQTLKIIEPYEAALAKIPEEDLSRLARRARPMIAETGLPLRKSATIMSIATGANHSKIAVLDEDDIKNIEDRSIDKTESTVVARAKSYDRETGRGKLREVTSGIVYPFIIVLADRKVLAPQIVRALDKRELEFTVRAIRDKSENITSLMVLDVSEVSI